MLLGSPLSFGVSFLESDLCFFSLEIFGSSLHSRIYKIYNFVLCCGVCHSKSWRISEPFKFGQSCCPWLWEIFVYLLFDYFLLSGPLRLIFDLLAFLSQSVSLSFCSALWDISLTLSLKLSIEFNILLISFLIPKNSSLFPIVPFVMCPNFVLWRQ